MKLRVTIIQLLLEINENLFFHPRLMKAYRTSIQSSYDDVAPVVLDVGSNKGQSIRFFTKLLPNSKIFGFEPNIDLYNTLALKYSESSTVKLFNCGVSDSSTTKTFFVNLIPLHCTSP